MKIYAKQNDDNKGYSTIDPPPDKSTGDKKK